MWVAPDSKATLEEGLFRFLLSVRDGRPEAARPLLATDATLREVRRGLNPQLGEALRHCLDAFLIQLTPDPAEWGELKIPASIVPLGMALNNCLVRGTPAPASDDFTKRLVAAIPPASRRDDALAYHALLRGVGKFLTSAEPWRAGYLHALVDRSPLTMLWALDVHDPPGLSPVAGDLLPPRRRKEVFGREMGETGWGDAGEWLRALGSLLADRRLARWVGHRWLAMPASLGASRNVGLLLELLRRQDDPALRDFVLSFYESYDYFRGEARTDEWGRRVRVWPELEAIDRMLRVPGDSDAAIEMTRRGNEHFLKFRPLVQAIIDGGGMPQDYALLTTDFVMTLRGLLNYVAGGPARRIDFTEAEFVSQP